MSRNRERANIILPASVRVECRDIPLYIRRFRRAKRLRLRYDMAASCIFLTLPFGVSSKQAAAFLSSSYDWLAAQVRLRRAVPFMPGVVIPYRGGERLLCYDESLSRAVSDDGERLICGGELAMFGGSIENFLRRRLRQAVEILADDIAMRLGCEYRRIRVGDAKTRWGSCSGTGTLSFNWRLILMREALLRYVVVHEVCHLRYMDHSAAFWRLVESELADYRALRAELRAIGASLRLVGVSP